jgi:hypothetical protein
MSAVIVVTGLIFAGLFFYFFANHFSRNSRDSPKDNVGADSADNIAHQALDVNSLGSFVSLFPPGKPADNVMLLAAWLYASYGVYPITGKEIKELGDSCGLIIPTRSDNTMWKAQRKGKRLFDRQGNGWQPTVSGEMFFQETYSVKKGNKRLPYA